MRHQHLGAGDVRIMAGVEFMARPPGFAAGTLGELSETLAISGRIYFHAYPADQAPCANRMVAMPCFPSSLAAPGTKCYYEALAMPDSIPLTQRTLALGQAVVGFRGRVIALDMSIDGTGLPPDELERRLLELGFVEGATVELLHQGLFGGDPIAVRVAGTTIALRRREAMAITVTREA
jgi:ferrous iron transport protein A